MPLVRVYDNERKAEYSIGSRAAESNDNLKILSDESAERDGRALPAVHKTTAKKAASGS